MHTRIGPEIRSRLEKVWDELISAQLDGVPFGPILEREGLKRDHVFAYQRENPEKDKDWVLAREAGADAIADKIEAIANNPGDDPRIAHVRMQAYQWAAGKRNPRVYGERQIMDITVKKIDLTRVITDAAARLAMARPGVRTIEHDDDQRLLERLL